MSTNGILSLTEHILEIRFKPNSKILDHRGRWAELISKELSLHEWLIVENRFDVYDKQKKETAFVGFRNCGYTCFQAPTANYFPYKAIKFFKLLLTFDDFGDPLFIERIGVRSKFITGHPKGFDDLRDRYASRYLILSDKAKEAIGGKLVDIGGPLNFADKFGNFNTVSGPMAKEQMKDFIRRDGEYPEAGLFYDIDYWQKPNKDLKGAEIIATIRSFATEAWNRHNRIHDLICGD